METSGRQCRGDKVSRGGREFLTLEAIYFPEPNLNYLSLSPFFLATLITSSSISGSEFPHFTNVPSVTTRSITSCRARSKTEAKDDFSMGMSPPPSHPLSRPSSSKAFSAKCTLKAVTDASSIAEGRFSAQIASLAKEAIGWYSRLLRTEG
ncbi:hypothetical protein TNCV_544721 [Trichonephila clavipes]|nr:hypothetical protein TNCV_544721 [Trichonephila clavipes]